ncbi:hypothetical protein GOV09_06955 [Candidatus Woesearchaeota archaeon]|nr:hypothetical protein [Candidatus Woesearchaeota archaeon]
MVKGNATVSRVDLFEYARPEMAVLRVEPDNPILYAPGQSMEVAKVNGADTLDARFFTPTWVTEKGCESLSPGPNQELEFIIALRGHVSAKLVAANPGERVQVGEPSGKFTRASYKPKPDDTLVYVSTGTGQTQNLLAYHDLMNGHRGNVVVVVSGFNSFGHPYHELHNDIQDTRANYRYIPLTTGVDRPDFYHTLIQDLFDGNGFHFTQLTGIELDPTNTQVILRGNPSMILGSESGQPNLDPEDRGMVQLLEAQGFQKGVNIHYENRFPKYSGRR